MLSHTFFSHLFLEAGKKFSKVSGNPSYPPFKKFVGFKNP